MDDLTVAIVVIFSVLFCLVLLYIMNDWRRCFNPENFVYKTKGECVPAAGVDGEGNILFVSCQDCGKSMTQQEHKDYFDLYIPWFEKKFKQEYSYARPNYDFKEGE